MTLAGALLDESHYCPYLTEGDTGGSQRLAGLTRFQS